MKQRLLRWQGILLILLLCVTQSFGQTNTRTVQGTIIDHAENLPLPGVSVLEKGTTNGTVTDMDGRFTLALKTANPTLVLSFIGFDTQEVIVGNQNNFEITLREDVSQLDEVVVVGYGTQKRSDITGSVASVPKDRLTNLPVTNFAHALQGTTAGLNINQTSSVPGSTATIQVRGINSINAATSPFIVVDGAPFFGNTNDINPNDIESIEILKDASATAIYGTRGSNGVILITTKRGKAGAPRISYNGYAGVEGFSHILEPMGPQAYLQKYADYMEARGLHQNQILPNTYEIQNYNEGHTTDWIDEVSQTGVIQEHNLSISGGTDNIKYYVAGGYLSQTGIIQGYQYERANVRTNIDANLTDFLTVGTSLFFTNNNHDGGRATFLEAAAMSPFSRPFDDQGQMVTHPMFPEQLFLNPLLHTTHDRVNRNRNLTGTVYAEIAPEFLKGFKYRLNASYVMEHGRTGNYSGRAAFDNQGTANVSNFETTNYVIENIFSYHREWGAHNFDFTGLYSAQQTDLFASSFTGRGFFNDDLSFYNIGAADNIAAGNIDHNAFSSGTFGRTSGILSQMARINYAYDSRYLLTVTARRDGYSAFGSNTNKYGLFPSIAIGWNIANEDFLKNSEAVSEMKIRFSYGQTGNMAIGVNQTATRYRSVLYPFDGSPQVGVLASIMGNNNLTWETTTSANLGVDFGFAQNRITGTVEVYNSITDDLLMQRNIPRVSGYGSVWDNLGKLQNRGLDFHINTVNVETSQFSWSTSFNFSTFRNKILDLYGDGRDDIANNWFIGRPLQAVFDYQLVGIWQEGEESANWDPSARPGDLKFADVNGDGVINANDRQFLGTGLPSWYGGLTNTFRFRNWHMSIFFDTSQGSLRNNPDMFYGDEAGRRNIPSAIEYWTPDNPTNNWPSLAYINHLGYGFPVDNSYVRLRDVRVSYVFPLETLDRIGISGLTVYVAGRNLYTFTDWIGWDPAMTQNSRGVGDWRNNYPLVRTFSLGVNLTL